MGWSASSRLMPRASRARSIARGVSRPCRDPFPQPLHWILLENNAKTCARPGSNCCDQQVNDLGRCRWPRTMAAAPLPAPGGLWEAGATDRRPGANASLALQTNSASHPKNSQKRSRSTKLIHTGDLEWPSPPPNRRDAHAAHPAGWVALLRWQKPVSSSHPAFYPAGCLAAARGPPRPPSSACCLGGLGVMRGMRLCRQRTSGDPAQIDPLVDAPRNRPLAMSGVVASGPPFAVPAVLALLW